MADDYKGILLETGTGEMEIVEFSLGDGLFGINVIKVREIIRCIPTVSLPASHPCLEGLIQLRGAVLPIIDLGKFLNCPPAANPDQERIIVTEFNQVKLGFRVHAVNRIHRIQWNQIEKPSKYSYASEGSVVGIIKLEEKLIVLLDFEKIVVDINPNLGFHKDSLKGLEVKDRSAKSIMVVEDSQTLRSFLHDVLTEAGYKHLTFFDNGAEAWERLETLAKQPGYDIAKDYQLIITDIEMPRMDGHQLTRNIKTNPALEKLPVIIFSSLITEDLMHKGHSVGANGQVSKPQWMDLAKMIDAHAL